MLAQRAHRNARGALSERIGSWRILRIMSRRASGLARGLCVGLHFRHAIGGKRNSANEIPQMKFHCAGKMLVCASSSFQSAD
jgi:hypothetical protein